MPSTFSSWKRGRTGTPVVAQDYGYKAYSLDLSSLTTGAIRSSNIVEGIVVKNTSGVSLLPKYTVSWKTTAIGQEVDGYVRTTAAKPAGIVDEHLPAAGVATGDIFFLVVKGPTLGFSSAAANGENVITAGDWLHALTAAASTHSTTAGRVYSFGNVFTATQTTDGTAADVCMNRIGRALSAKTTSQSNGDVLLYAMLGY